MFNNRQRGQSLLELIVVIAVGILVVGALVFATISSLRNAQFAKNQAQATKLSQEGMERVRGIRDRNDLVQFNYSGGQTQRFADLWAVPLRNSCNPCYFRLDSTQQNLSGGNSWEDLGNNFSRQIEMSDDANWAQEKMMAVVVRWNDFAGLHESKLTTILRKI